MSKLKEYLRSINWLHQLYNWLSQRKYVYCYEWRKILIARLRYVCNLRKVKSKYRSGRKIRVIFPLSNPSKWKVQSLYDLMEKSERFEPVVAATLMDKERDLDIDGQRKQFNILKSFLEAHRCKWVEAYDINSKTFKAFSDLGADIVWYTQPWDIVDIQGPYRAAVNSLTCYTPYFVQNYGGLDMDCLLFFHRLLWRHFTLTECWAKIFMEAQGKKRAGDVVGLGHPMLDQFYVTKDKQYEGKYVIYAPHWSCGVSECFSTFLKNGEKILEFAKAHPEIKWVFKPHPTLRSTLERYCGWTKNAVDQYYAEWEKIAISCYDADYVTLFRESMAMITDCASFLVEYACTGYPIIHLISSEAKYQPHPIAAKLFSTYYQAHNWDEFIEHFNEVILKRNDYKREDRLREVKNMRLLDNYAAKNIMEYLDKEFSSK